MSKKDKLAVLIDSENPDVIVGSEIWLKKKVHSDSEFMPETYSVYRTEKKRGIRIRRDLQM